MVEDCVPTDFPFNAVGETSSDFVPAAVTQTGAVA